MNTALEKILKDFETQHGFGSVEIVFCNGAAVTVHVKKTHKLTSNFEPNSQRENRGVPNGKQQTESR